jgi:hypothetical protein
MGITPSRERIQVMPREIVFQSYRGPSSHSGSSAIRSFYDALTGQGEHSTGMRRVEPQGVVAGSATAAGTGALLAVVNSHSGLDIKGNKAMPADLIGGLLAQIAGRSVTAHGNSTVGKTLSTAGKSAVAIFGFRATSRLLGAKAAAHGDFGEESPIEEAAKHL